MPLIRIDETKCIECGSCARDCVSAVILQEGDKPLVKNPRWCNRCSHCVAICPSGAIDHDGLKGLEPRPIDREKLDPESYSEIVMTRRSVRNYKNEEVPADEIKRILDLANYSPTASNNMDVGYVVITDRELIKKTGAKIFGQGRSIKRIIDRPWGKPLLKLIELIYGKKTISRYVDRFDLYSQWVDAGRDMIAHNAPALIIIHGPEKNRFAQDDCAIAATNITNYAHARGLGTCYIGMLVVPMGRNKKLRKRMGVPDGRKAYTVLTLGVPAKKYRNTPIRPPANVSWIKG